MNRPDAHTNERTLTAAAESAGRRTLVNVLALTAFVTLVVFAARPAHGNGGLAKTTVVTSTQSSLGRILVDSRGRTLYLFEKDKLAMSACAGSCAAYWPPLLTTRKPTAAMGVKPALLGMTRRSDGTLQVTYAGHPLYTFELDTKPGQAKGEGTNAFGGEWYVLGTSGTKLEKRQASRY